MTYKNEMFDLNGKKISFKLKQVRKLSQVQILYISVKATLKVSLKVIAAADL